MDNIELINFTELSLETKKMVLEWRNHPNIKKWMYSHNDISLEDHLKFIETLKSTDDKLYFLVKNGDEYIGVIDFTSINDKSADIGIYSNPQKKGVGVLLMEVIINYSFESLKLNTIFAEVFFENKRAYRLYSKLGFREHNKKEVNGKKVICMELKNENR